MRRHALLLLLIVLSSFLAAPAFAADAKVEKEAKALQKKAIEEDNLNVDYPAAIKKLVTAVGKCGADKCGNGVKASLLRDLGAMQILNGSVDEGRASFDEALKLDPSLDLDPAYKNPMLEGIWNAQKKKAGVAAAPTPPPPPEKPEKPGKPSGEAPSGDFVHAPASEGLVRTPLPVYVEYPGGESLARVIVKYKGFGMTDWRPLDLQKMGSGYGGMIPCKDTTQGPMQYFVQGFSAQNDPVANSGSRNKPYTVQIKPSIAGAPPSLPGQEPPKQCEELVTAECPPDFPGCNNPKKDTGEDCDKGKQCKSGSCVGGKCIEKKGGGEECESDDECQSGSCKEGKCAAEKKGDGEECSADDECQSGSCKEDKCAGGEEKKAGGKFPRFWVGVAGSLDISALPRGDDVCKLNKDGTGPFVDPANNQTKNGGGNPYWCTDTGGADYPSNPTENDGITPGRSDQVQGGVKLANIRLMLSLDYAVSQNVLVGVRGGYVLNTYPGTKANAFAPVHAEARITYLVGKDALTKKGLSPMIIAGAGAGEFDAFVPVVVFVTGQPGSKTENAWVVGGPGFGMIGGGVRVLLSPKAALTAALKGQAAFGGTTTLIGVAPELGFQVGF